jgi:hypothetical protein
MRVERVYYKVHSNLSPLIAVIVSRFRAKNSFLSFVLVLVFFFNRDDEKLYGYSLPNSLLPIASDIVWEMT